MQSEIVKQRNQLTELILVAVGVSFGVNLLAAGVVLATDPPGILVIGAGALVLAAGLLFLVRAALKRTHKKVVLEGVLTSKEKTERKLVPIERYEFSEHITRFFKAMASENKALGAAWQTLPASTEEGEYVRARIAPDSLAANLVREAMEYYVLDELSLHLTDYFNGDWATEKTVTYGRKSIPSVLLDNRFLDLFSRPMEEREAFHDQNAQGGVSTDDGKIVLAYGPDGAIFDNFELVLPKGTKVERTGPNKVRIRNSRFSLVISIQFHPYGAVLPTDFEELYMGENFTSIHTRHAAVHLEAKFSIFNLLSRSGKEHFDWVEEFLEKMETKLSFKRFLDDVHWEAAHTVAIATRSRKSTN